MTLPPGAPAPAYAAQRALTSGDWKSAALQLEQAAAQLSGDALRAGHCLQMAASLRRASGDSALALATAERIQAIDPGNTRLQLAAQVERAQALQQCGQWQPSSAAWSAALHSAQSLGLAPEARASVRRQYATSLAHAGEHAHAWQQFDSAAQEMERAGDLAPWVDIEQARCACQCQAWARADELLQRERLTSAVHGDPHLRSEWLLARALSAIGRQDWAGARELALGARDAALQAVAPLSYFAAAAALSQACQNLGQDEPAYAALTTAWATLADLLGAAIAQSWVAPLLHALRWQWGEQRFARVRSRYESQRRAQLAAHHGERKSGREDDQESDQESADPRL